jgi:hypothetical protein
LKSSLVMKLKLSAAVLIFIWVGVLSSPTTFAKAWRGIVPLHSTRADVEKSLGSPNFEDGYEIDGDRVTINYAAPGCQDGLPSGWNVPGNTVVNISVSSTTDLNLEDVLVQGKNYEKIYGTDPSHIDYVDNQEGVRYVTVDGALQSITYFANADDDHKLRCGEPRYAAPVPPGAQNKFEQRPFDSFGRLPFTDAETRLDTFLAVLLNLNQGSPHYRGFIITYGGRSAHPNEAATFAECAKTYLVRERQANPEFLISRDGGYRDEFTVELFIMPNDAYPPMLTPTVSPRKVRILPEAFAPCGK